MKKNRGILIGALMILIVFSGIILMMQSLSATNYNPLKPAPDTIAQYNEIAVVYPQRLTKLYNDLTPQERVVIYYLHRACLAGNLIAADQIHRNALEIRELFETVLEHKDRLLICSFDFDIAQFISEVTTYLVYHWTNHSQYFLREHEDHKRTPERLGFYTLTKHHLMQALTALDYKNVAKKIDRLSAAIFDCHYEPTLVVPADIENSAVNFYSPDFTNEDFKKLSPAEQTAINNYGYIEQHNEKRIAKTSTYAIDQKYDEELKTAYYWLEKAWQYAQNFPAEFDEHFVRSLQLMCDFIETGNEKLFKQHSIAWLKSKSRIDYCWGFIENYDDPMSYRGMYQGEATIKSMDIERLSTLLPEIEASLPFPQKFKRKNLNDVSALPNASMNTKAFTSGHLGPFNMTLAYCLPNYTQIRAEHGSKQIIYEAEKGLGERINQKLHNKLFYPKEQADWLAQHDPDGIMRRKIMSLHVILHETLGHGSGRPDIHTFVEGDPLTIEGKTYQIGDTIPVTSSNIQQFLVGYDQTLEELRAEIIALYSSITFFDTFANSGFLDDWPKKIDKQKMIEWCILDMCYFGLNRLLAQPDEATHISGDHARANTTILNWLTDRDGITIVEEKQMAGAEKHTVIGIKVIDTQKAIDAITKLAQTVQAIKSTADGVAVKDLIETYGKPIHHPEYILFMKANRKAVVGNLKMSATLFPYFEPVKNKNGDIIDINATWPQDIVEQNAAWKKLRLSMQ